MEFEDILRMEAAVLTLAGQKYSSPRKTDDVEKEGHKCSGCQHGMANYVIYYQAGIAIFFCGVCPASNYMLNE